jgi:hypothetical protein
VTNVAGAGLDEPALVGEDHELGAVAQAELGEDARQVRLDGRRSDEQALGDLGTTQLRAVDGTVWHVRNGEIDRVGNLSRDWRRVPLDVEVARGADLPLATRTVEHAAQELCQDEQWRPWLMDEPEIWGVEGLGPASATIRLGLKTRELRARVDEAIEQAGSGRRPAPRRRDLPQTNSGA